MFVMGVEELDQDHKQFMRISEMIADRVDHPESDDRQWPFLVREGLKYVHGHIQSHFRREEEYMERIGYIHYESHTALHRELEQKVTQYISSQIEGKSCTLDDVLMLLGATYGWMMLHVAMDDMAIVGKGVMALPPEEAITETTLIREADAMLQSAMGLDAQTKILDRNYRGDGMDSAVCQKITYDVNGTDVTVLLGLERTLLRHATEAYWTDRTFDKARDRAHMVLIQWCLTAFAVGFWRNMIARFTHDRPCVLKDVRQLDSREARQVMRTIEPRHSTLYQTDQGRFFIVSAH
jgi:hemerythrin-like metal-binding protein